MLMKKKQMSQIKYAALSVLMLPGRLERKTSLSTGQIHFDNTQVPSYNSLTHLTHRSLPWR